MEYGLYLLYIFFGALQVVEFWDWGPLEPFELHIVMDYAWLNPIVAAAPIDIYDWACGWGRRVLNRVKPIWGRRSGLGIISSGN